MYHSFGNIALKQMGPIPNQYKPQIYTNLFDYRLTIYD